MFIASAFINSRLLKLSGTASNGVDYVSLPGSVTFAPDQASTNIYVQTIADTLIEGDETAILTLLFSGDSYLIDTNNAAATNIITDTIGFVTGFTNGDMFFGNDTHIGWLSKSGGGSNMNWCTLTNASITNALPLRGSLHWDETGTWSNNLIAVTSPGSGEPGLKEVWRVNAQKQPTLVAYINTPHLEGVTTITNDVARWGPWAGKIITGDEDGTNGIIYTIATNGVVVTNISTALIAEGIYPEDFDVIPPNQSLYICDYTRSAIVKLPAAYFANYVGDLLITEAGEFGSSAKFFIVHWNGTGFTVKKIPYDSQIEHVTFAPIDLPASTP